MLKNYIKSAFRSMIRNINQTLINILGLALGMTCSLLIFLWVQDQLSYDQWQIKKNNIYRLESNTWVIMPPYLADLVNELPEVKKITRFNFQHVPTVKYKNNLFTLNNLAYTDRTVFNIFNFNFLRGDPRTALQKPFSIILTQSISKKLFDDENPIGKQISFNNKLIYTVTAIIDDVENFHLEIDAIAALQDIAKIDGNNKYLESRYSNFLIYILLNDNTNYKRVERKINELIYEDFKEEQSGFLLLRPFKEIYFERGLEHEWIVKHGNYNLIIIFISISLLILIIACINFINLTTAKANKREKEIGIRKIVGAKRKMIVFQFLAETFFIVLLAHIVSIVLLEFILPRFNIISNENISFSYLSPQFIITVISLMVITTILAGIYPSIYLSSLKPLLILKGKSSKNTKGSLRKILMIIQFSISIFLIISTLIILKQLNYVLNKDLGWDTENVLMFKLKGENFDPNRSNFFSNKSTFKNELLKNPNIKNVSYVTQFFGNLSNTWTWRYKGEKYSTKIFRTDPDCLETLGLQLIDGRNFSYNNKTDSAERKMIINETAVKVMRLKNPVGTILKEHDIEIIGVIKDINFNSLHNKIEPLALQWYPESNNICVRISSESIFETIKYVTSLYSEFCPNDPFEYHFMDDYFAKQYESEMKQSQILLFFAIIAIFLASLGLFGMASFVSTTRIKEIGIRKALGSSTREIMVLFFSSFIRWIIVSFIIASPIAYISVEKWLMQYPYKTNMSWWIFLIALLITVLITLVTIGYQVIKSARTNPAECLRYE